MVADQAGVLADAREVVRAHHRRTFGSDFMPDKDDTNIHIGDIVNTEPAAAPRGPRKGLSPLAHALIGAAIMGTAGPLGLLAFNALTTKPPSPAPVVTPVVTPAIDNDHQYEIRLVP